MNKQNWKLFPLDWVLLSTVIYAAMRCLQTSYAEFQFSSLIKWQ